MPAIHSADLARLLDRVRLDNSGKAYVSYVKPNSPLHTSLIELAQGIGLMNITLNGTDIGVLTKFYSLAREAANNGSTEKLAREVAKHNRLAVGYGSGGGAGQYDPANAPITSGWYIEPYQQAPFAPPPPPTAKHTCDLEPRVKTLEDSMEGVVENVIKAIEAGVDSEVQRQTGELAARINDMVEQAIKAKTPTTVVIQRPNVEPVNVGVQHYKLPQVLRYLNRRQNVYLHGPAGSGKTTLGHTCAKALGVEFYASAKLDSEYLLIGFKGANGETVRTPFREAFEHGGLFLFDELDASSPSAVVALNMALANGLCSFPDKLVTKHPDFYCIAAGNTQLSGSSNQYVGRMQLDAASIDRFAFIEFPYDEQLEVDIAPHKGWCRYVQAVRAVIKERGFPHLVTPRATLEGGALIMAGESPAEVKSSWLWKGLDEDTVRQIEQAIPREFNLPDDPLAVKHDVPELI